MALPLKKIAFFAASLSKWQYFWWKGDENYNDDNADIVYDDDDAKIVFDDDDDDNDDGDDYYDTYDISILEFISMLQQWASHQPNV